MQPHDLHTTVLLNEAVDALITNVSGCYVDATFGRGGHSENIIKTLDKEGRLIAIDQDDTAVEAARSRFDGEQRFSIFKRNFVQLEQLMAELELTGRVDGLLLDLGISSPQVDNAERGFSFQASGPLDMRMDQQQTLTAQTWVNSASQADIAKVLRDYGDERYAGRIATAIVKAREEEPITTTDRLADIVKVAHPRWDHQRHPATKTFQAIRIYINDEIAALQAVLEQAERILKTGGRLVVISFHSLEDRLVKRSLRAPTQARDVPRHLPLPAAKPLVWRRVSKAIFPSEEEINSNPRARSAVMRVAERLS